MKEIFYAVVCSEAGICGAFCTKKEARDWQIDTDLIMCPAKHKIVKCEIKILK